MNPSNHGSTAPVRDIGRALAPITAIPTALTKGGAGEIDRKVADLPAARLGRPTGVERVTSSGRVRTFEKGDVYWSAATGVHEVHGGILAAYKKTRGPRGALGFPRTDEEAAGTAGARRSRFEGGTIYWSKATGANVVHGEIHRHYRRLNEDRSLLGLPTSGEFSSPGGGRRCEFQRGTIYWSPRTGAFEVHGAIRARYLALGGPGGFLGYPITDECDVLDAAGRPTGGKLSRFEGGTIYWSSASGACEVHGRIRDFYEQMGGPRSKVGYPITNEAGIQGTDIRYNDFQKGIVVYRPTIGARAITELQLFLDRVVAGEIDDGRSSWLVTPDRTAELVTYVTVKANGKTLESNKRMPSGHAGASYDWDKPYKIAPVSHATAIHLKIKVDDYDELSGNDFLGTLDRTFDIKTCFGIDNGRNGIYADQPATSKGSSLPRLTSLRFTFRISPPPASVDFSQFRHQGWWSFDNFKTATLPRKLFAETFRDVDIVEGTLEEILNPFESLYYELVFKGVAAKGNCFGMSLEGAFALTGRSLFAEPIHQYFASGTKVGDVPEAQIAEHIRKTINMKHSHQVGADAITWVIDRITSLDAIRPLKVYDRVKYFLAKRDWPIVSMVDLRDFGGHAVLPYRCVDGAGTAPHKILVADPNVVWSEKTDDPTWIEIRKDDTFKFVGGSSSYESGRIGSVLPSTLMFEIPFHRLAPSPRTPFWELMLAIGALLGGMLILAGDAETTQITGDGSKLYRPNRGGGRDIVPGAADGLARLPLLDFAGPLPELYGKRGPLPADLKIELGGRKQGAYRHGIRTSTHAVTVSSPVGPGETDTIAVVNGGTAAPTVEIITSNPGKRAKVETAAVDDRTGKTRLAYSLDVQLAKGAVARVMPRGPGLLVTPAGPPQPFEVRIRSGERGAIRESKVKLTPTAGETLAVLPERLEAPHGPLVVERWSSADGGVLSRSIETPE